jgi:aspartate racemase
MKLIGILGGTSWPSTVLPYRLLNLEVARRLGPTHSARIALYSIDYHAIRACYTGDWNAIAPLLLAEIHQLLGFRPDCWMIANNTLHKVLDTIADQLPAQPPLFHAVHLVRDHLLARGAPRTLLLGTRFTMEDGYYADPLRAVGIEVVTPNEPDRARIGAIQMELAAGRTDAAFTQWFADLLARHAAQGCAAVVLGCTELPLAITTAPAGMELVDPLVLQCRACVDFALTD